MSLYILVLTSCLFIHGIIDYHLLQDRTIDRVVGRDGMFDKTPICLFVLQCSKSQLMLSYVHGKKLQKCGK